jgi:hypothetical protein
MSVTKNVKPLPTTFIYKEVVAERIKNYREKKLPLLSNAIGKPDTESGWYSLSQFEELMREMYYQHADGLRIYFGAHGSDDPLYPDQLTVIFVPTFYNPETNSHEDIVIEQSDSFDTRAAAYEAAMMTKGVNQDVTKNIDTLTLCPPLCKDQTHVYTQ